MYAPGRKLRQRSLDVLVAEAIHRPGANEMRLRPSLDRIQAGAFARPRLNPFGRRRLQGADHIVATRGDGYALVYDAQGRPFTLTLGKISGDRVKCWWYNPRSGDSMDAGQFDNKGTQA